MAFAKGDVGYDPSAPLGSPQHPEPLVDGATVCRPAVAAGTARHCESGDDGLLARVAAEAQAGREVITRARSAARRAEIARLERQLAAERREAAPPGRVVTRAEPPPPVSRTSGGPVPPLAAPEYSHLLPRDGW